MRILQTSFMGLVIPALLCGCASIRSNPRGASAPSLIEVEGVLIEKTKCPRWDEVAPFASTRAECRYRGSKGTFIIQHWAIINAVPCDSYLNLEVGRRYAFCVMPSETMTELGRYSRQLCVEGKPLLWDLDDFGCVSFTEWNATEPVYVEVVYIPNIAKKTSNQSDAGEGQ